MPAAKTVVLSITAAALIAGSLFWINRPKPVTVVVSEVARGEVEASIANTRAGTVEACQRTKLSTIIGGRIEYLGVKEGDRVAKGQLLLKLWNDDQQANAALAQAQIALAARRSDEVCIAAVNAENRAYFTRSRPAVAGSRLTSRRIMPTHV